MQHEVETMSSIKANIETHKRDIKVLMREMYHQLGDEYKRLKDEIESNIKDTQISSRRKSIQKKAF
jgi:hypothetical protein